MPVCEALAAGARVGIVHRDVKPANIFLHRAGGEEVPKVLDFGIARIVGEAAADPPSPSTASWSARRPTWRPSASGDQALDGRPDVYSVGVTLYQMLTGRLPFAADRPGPAGGGDAAPRGAAAADERPDVPAAVEEVVMNALRKPPDTGPTRSSLGQDLRGRRAGARGAGRRTTPARSK